MVSFQGVLKDSLGQPLSGAVTLEFRIFDAPTAGNLVDMDGDGAVENVVGQDVKEVSSTAVLGVVSTQFGPVSPTVFNGQARYIEVTIVSPGPITALNRVSMTTSPAIAEQLYARGTTSVAVSTDTAGNVGIGTTTPTAKLHVAGATGIDGIRFPDGTLQTTAGTRSVFVYNLIAERVSLQTIQGTEFQTIPDSSVELTLPAGRAVIVWSVSVTGVAGVGVPLARPSIGGIVPSVATRFWRNDLSTASFAATIPGGPTVIRLEGRPPQGGGSPSLSFGPDDILSWTIMVYPEY